MKNALLTLSLITFLTNSAFAALPGSYKLVSNNQNGGSDLCTSILTIVKIPNGLSISTTPELGSYFNVDSSDGALNITNINKGEVVDNSTNGSHGEKYETKNVATMKGDQLNLSSITKSKTFGVTTSKTVNTLSLTKTGKDLSVKINRSYDEVAGSGWGSAQTCKYISAE